MLLKQPAHGHDNLFGIGWDVVIRRLVLPFTFGAFETPLDHLGPYRWLRYLKSLVLIWALPGAALVRYMDPWVAGCGGIQRMPGVWPIGASAARTWPPL